MTEQELESLVGRLVGQRIQRVRYFEIDYADGGEATPAWCEDERFDSLDFGLDLLTADNLSFDFTWGNEYLAYNAMLFEEAMRSLYGACTWDVTGSSRWQGYIGKPIVDAQVSWEWEWAGNDNFVRKRYPQTITLVFGGCSPVYISALEVNVQVGWPGMHFSDHITVFFDSEVAASYGVEPYGATPEAQS